jgi:cytochrome c oxidase subunit IV
MAKVQDRTQTKVVTRQQSHPTMKTFFAIGAVLFVLTGIEFSIVYLQGMKLLVVAALGILSVVKFFLVAGYFMHLKWDSKLLTWVFTVGVVLALLIAVAQKFVNLA